MKFDEISSRLTLLMKHNKARHVLLFALLCGLEDYRGREKLL